MIPTRPPLRPRTLTALLVLTVITTARLWWVPARCLLDERDFQWGTALGGGQLAGQGLGGDLLILLLLSAYAVAMLYLGWHGGRQPFAGMALVWFGVHVVSSVLSAAEGGLIWYGDALGLRLNLTWISLAVNGTALTIALVWLARDWRTPSAPPFVATARTRKLLLAAAALLPVQIVLFQIGPLHDPTDITALGLTVGQWVLLNAAWAAARPLAEQRDPLAPEEPTGQGAELRAASGAAGLA